MYGIQTGILIEARRRQSSRSGNPRYFLTIRTETSDWTTSTAPDSFSGYAVQNIRIGTMVRVVVEPAGVTMIEKV